MEIYKLNEMKSGWFVGNFHPTAYKTDQFEVCYRTHKKNEKWETHYHQKITEINLLVSGKMIIQNTELNSGDIFIIKPFEIADPIFIEDCTILCVKTPCIVGDKTIIKEN
jgi:hypothetical protein